jgi:hypothetical protein
LCLCLFEGLFYSSLGPQPSFGDGVSRK